MKKKFVFAFNLFIISSYIFPLLLSKSNNELANQHYDNYNESTIISLSSVEENIFNNKDNSQIQLDNNRKFDSSQKLLSGIFETSNRQAFVIDAPSKLVFFSEESNDIIDVILKNNLMDYKMEEIVNNTFFLNYTNITLINHHCRNILNITNNETINYTLIDNLLHKFVIHKKGLEAKKAFRNSDGQNNNTLEYSYIFLINTKILYYNYQIYSREFTDNRIYFWDIRLEDMMADTEFLNSTEFNRTEAIAVINTFSSKYNLMKNDYNQIDFTIRNLVQSNYENEMFNRTGLSAEEKDLIMKMIQMKRNYKNFLLQKRLKELEYLESHIGMEMIVNDTLYVRKINLTEWNRIEQIGRKFTNNSNLSEKVNWREFDRIFAKYKSNYIDSENIVNDEYYMGFKEIALFERDYYVWRKNKIENPVSPKKVKSQITNPASDSLFTDIGKNIHDSLQPLALAKISEKRIRYEIIISGIKKKV